MYRRKAFKREATSPTREICFLRTSNFEAMKKLESLISEVNVCQVLKIPHMFYIHVKDRNTGYERLVVGPRTFTSEEYEEVVKPPTKMIIVPPEHFVVVVNPLVKENGKGEIVMLNGQAKLRMGEKEIMFHQPPFPLYPGQEQEGPVSPLTVVQENEALLLRAEISFTDRSDNTKREAGVTWLFKGPAVYIPQVEITVIKKISAIFIKPNEALMVKAKEDFEWNGELKKVGQSWLVKSVGPYLPGVHEEVGNIVKAIVLDFKTALHVSALRTFIDEKGVTRKAGTQWLVTLKDYNVYFPGVDEKIEKNILLTILKGNEYCVILDPYDETTGKYRLGSNRLVKGPTQFFLHPEERLKEGVKVARLLKRNNGVWLTAKEEFRSEDGVLRKPGSQWHVSGPCLFYPPLETDTLFSDALISIDYPFHLTIFHPHHLAILGLVLSFFIYQVSSYLK